ncbi:MAG: hypothetical protein COV30_01620 [Candidatus Yanofskybacteria bacterium CG10_big_fil_rev_8_21_14_0_10_37_15]|uniref:Uncharacterized protein n=1 Tax=Candidatus Yanofskybacteria bacterium CG10_big_fil_rev_8_21_14_0_10_37_15 TaxID=1975097 RepID=A0A2H0R5W4_9BACT|nr:MAG: hypothetical protein COV30_01620 [Candidatus Yanofskybacteria bacterium CG10_big_fil_rev_8_21_14_0_10_37_15]
MSDEESEKIKAFLCFDANLPNLERCKTNCASSKKSLCIHGFKNKVKVEVCDPKRFHAWSDLRVFTWFLGNIFVNIANGIILPNDCLLMILTKDRNFIEDVKKEWEEKRLWEHLSFVFSNNSISCGRLEVFVQQIDCLNYGNSRTDNLRCAFEKVNSFFLSKNNSQTD